MHPTITVAFILGRPAVDVAWVDAVLGTLKWAKNVGGCRRERGWNSAWCDLR